MTSSKIKIADKASTDPLDRVIFGQGLRIKRLFFDTELDSMLILLTNGKVLNLKISGFPRLKEADLAQLNAYELEGDGVAVSWETFNEDLSLKGFIRQAAMEEAIYHLAKVA